LSLNPNSYILFPSFPFDLCRITEILPNLDPKLNENLRFGGIPWLLIIPVVLGVVLAILIQAVSLYSEWSEAKDRKSHPWAQLGPAGNMLRTFVMLLSHIVPYYPILSLGYVVGFSDYNLSVILDYHGLSHEPMSALISPNFTFNITGSIPQEKQARGEPIEADLGYGY
jgi:hypothetical protein